MALRAHRELARIERDRSGKIVRRWSSPYRTPMFRHWSRQEMARSIELADGALRSNSPVFSRTARAVGHRLGMEIVDAARRVAVRPASTAGSAVGSVVLGAWLDEIHHRGGAAA